MANNNKKFAVKNGLLTQNIDFLSPDESNVIAVTMSNADVLNVDGTLSATTFSGSGASLTTLNASNISSGTLAQARLANASITINGTSIALGGTATITANGGQSLTLGSYLTGGSYNGGAAVTANVDATTTNTASKVVARDANGSFAANIITATLSGSATSATTAGTITTAAQPNITSVGTLTSLAVTGTTTSGNFTTTGNANVGILNASGKIIGTNAGDLILNSTAGATEGSQITLAWKTVTGLTGQGNGTWNMDSDNSNNFRIFYQNATGVTAVPLTAYSSNNDVAFAANVIGTHYGAATGLTGIPGANVTGTVANATYAVSAGTAGTVTTAAQPNITSTGTLVNLYVNATVNAVAFTSNVATGIAPFTVTSTTRVANLNVATAGVADNAGTVTTAAQPNITSVGTLTSLGVSGNITAANITANTGIFAGNGSGLTALNASNISTGTLAQARLANASVTYNGVAVALGSSGTITANTTQTLTLGSYLTGTSFNGGTAVTAAVDATSANTASKVVARDASGNFSAGTITATLSGSATTAGTVTTNAQPNITSVGTLTSLAVTGNITSGNLSTGGELSVTGNTVITGNLTVNGSTIYSNVAAMNIKDPIIELGGTGNASNLTSNDGKDRGELLHVFDVAANAQVDKFIGWDNSNAEFAFGSNVTTLNEVVTFNALGNVRAGYFIGNGSSLASIAGANVTGTVANATYATSAGTAGTVTTAAQPNITSTGTLVNLYVNAAANAVSFTSNVATGTAPLTVTSTTRVANLNVAYANVADYINVTTGTTGNVYPVFGNAVTGNVIEYANSVYVANLANGSFAATTFVGALSGTASLATYATTANAVAGANVSGTVANATYAVSAGSATTATSATSATSATTAGTVTTAAQPNITSTGTLTSLTVTGTTTSGNLSTAGNLTTSGNVSFTGANISLGNVGNLKITGGTANQFLRTDGAGTLSWQTASSAATTSIQEFIATASQTTFTVVGTYIVGSVLVFVNGIQMNNADYTATNGTTIVLTEGRIAGDTVRVISSVGAVGINNIQNFSVAMSIAMSM